MKKKTKGMSFVLGTLVGATVAGISALLYTPKSGKELRKDMEDKAEDAKEVASDYVDTAIERGKALVETVQKAGATYKKGVEEAAKQVKTSVQDLRHQSVDTQKDDVSEGDSKEDPKETMEDTSNERELKTDDHASVSEKTDIKQTMEDTDEKTETASPIVSDEVIDADSLKEEIEQRTMDLALDAQESDSDPDAQTVFKSIHFPDEQE